MMARVLKAVIPAAGCGTRFLPATKSQPKEMLPLIDKPMIQYAVEEALASGIEQIIIVTALGKQATKDHFARSFGLEYILEGKREHKLLEEVRSLSVLANISYIQQKEHRTHIGVTAKRLFSNSNRHCEPFASCHPERSEESHNTQGRLREAILLLLSEIAELVPSKARKLRVCFVASTPRNHFVPRNDN